MINIPDPEEPIKHKNDGDDGDGSDLSDSEEPDCCTGAVRNVTTRTSDW